MPQKYNKKPITFDTVKAYIQKRIEVDDESKCWNWIGSFRNDYGRVRGPIQLYLNGEQASHRISYIVHVGQIDDGMVIRHRCNNKRCCNPDHLKPGSHSENMLDKSEPYQDQTMASLINLKRYHEAIIRDIEKEMGRRT